MNASTPSPYHRESAIGQLAILGAGGDLTARLLIPALARLHDDGLLPDRLAVIAVGREDVGTRQYRDRLRNEVPALAPDVSRKALDGLLARVRYEQADATSAAALAEAVSMSRPTAFYLALPPAVFEPVVAALKELRPTTGSRIVVEKPFGSDLTSARRLNARLLEVFPEDAVHRVDHFLAEQTVQNLLGLRLANRIFEPLWSREHVARVEIVWDETLTAEGRAGYYDHVGALRDMIQNHLLQILALVALEPPQSLSARDLGDRKVEALRAVRSPSELEVASSSVRARYGAGWAEGSPVSAYADEPGVDPARETETFVEITLAVDNWRWAGVPFVLRTGKALVRDRREIAIHFQPVPHLAFLGGEPPRPNVLRLSVDPDTMAIEITVNGAGDPFAIEPAALEARLADDELPAYARVLLDVFAGDSRLSVRADEAEEQWRIVEPVLAAWANGKPSLDEYRAASSGPS